MRVRKKLRQIAAGVSAFVLAVSMIPADSLNVVETKAATESAIEFKSAANYGSDYTDSFKDVAYTKDGGFVAVGYTYGSSTLYDQNWTLTDYEDGLIIKYNANHEIEWMTTVDCTSSTKTYDVLYGVDVLSDGRIAVVGTTQYVSGSYIKGTAMFVGIYNANDPSDYTIYHIGTSSGDQGLGIAATSDGGFVAGGWTAGKAGY